MKNTQNTKSGKANAPELVITECKVFPIKKPLGNVKAFASITFNDSFVVTGIRVIEGAKGTFIGMPSQKGNDDEYYDVAFPITKELRAYLTEVVLKEYEG